MSRFDEARAAQREAVRTKPRPPDEWDRIDLLKAEWYGRVDEGTCRGAATQRMVELRAALLKAGYWKVVYGKNGG